MPGGFVRKVNNRAFQFAPSAPLSVGLARVIMRAGKCYDMLEETAAEAVQACFRACGGEAVTGLPAAEWVVTPDADCLV